MRKFALHLIGIALICSQASWAQKNAATVIKSTPIPSTPSCPIFPADNVWNADISGLPVDPSSAAIINQIGAATGLHPDFGSFAGYGIPFNIVGSSTPKTSLQFQFSSESDAGPYPIPANYLIEGNDKAACNNGTGGDCHVLMVDKDACYLYELYFVQHLSNGSWQAGSGAIWNLNSNALRPDGWTSADAAGLPILPGLVRYDEVTAGLIDHALRFTIQHSRNAHIYPARHDAGSASYLSPMGMRVRLKASVDISGFSPQSKVILAALKKYGMMVADNGSNWYISGASDPRFDDNDLHNLKQITGSDFEVVDTSGLVNGPGDFTLALSNPVLGPVFPGQTAVFNGSVSSAGNYSFAIDLSCGTGAPLTCSPNPPSPRVPASFMISTSASSAQDYVFPVIGAGADQFHRTHQQTATLHVIDFNLITPSPAAVSAYPGSTSSAATFQVAGAGSFALPVNLSCSGLPAGAACVFAPSAQVNPTAGNPILASVTITVPNNAPLVDSTITITASTVNPAATRTTSFVLSVADFAISVFAPNTLSVVQGNPSSAITATVTALGSFRGTIALNCSGLPGAGGASCNFFPAVAQPRPGNPATFSVIIDSNAAAPGGPYTITVNATSLGEPVPKTAIFQLTITGNASSANLAATLGHSTPDPLIVGGQTVFQASVKNVASSGSVQATLLVTFSELGTIGMLPSGCALSNGGVSCSAQLASGGSQSFTIPVTVPFVRAFTAYARASSALADPVPGNNVVANAIPVRLRPQAHH